MVIGTAGAGFVAIAPRLANDTGGATTNAVYYTDSSFATSAVSQTSATTGVLLAQSNSDYTAAQLASTTVGSTIQARLVSMGLRVRYRGTELDRGGRILTLEEPDHGTLQGATSTVLLAYERCHEHAVTSGKNDWVKVQYSGPVAPDEYDFKTPNSIPGAGGQGAYMVAFVESKVANQFDWEAFWNWEIIGAPVRGKSYNEADDQGTAVVLGAVRNQNDAGLDSKSPLVASPQKIIPYADAYASNNLSGFLAKTADNVGEALMMAPNPILRGGGAVLKGGAALFNWFKGHH